MKKLAMLLAFFVFIGLYLTMAQTVQITGTVTSSEDGQPLPGASVMVKGTTIGTTTDFQGKYSLSVPSDTQILIISYVGMKSQEIPIAGKPIIDAVLIPGTVGLEEIVVTALGIKREQKALGYSVSKLNSDQIVDARETNLINAIAGKVAGVYVNNSSGMAGSSARIVIRGTSSLSYDTQPLFVVDGIPYDNSEYKYEEALFYGSASNTAIDIDPNQIENISILKGAAASALYGSRAGGGVVMITTKGGAGVSKAPTIELSSNTAFDYIRPQKLQDKYGQGTRGNYRSGEGSQKTSLSWGPLLDTTNLPKYNRYDFFRTGHTYDNSISINGAIGEQSSYYLSYSNYNQTGTTPDNDFARNSLMGKFTSKLSKKLTLFIKMGYTRSDNDRLPEGNGISSPMWMIENAPVTYNLFPAVDSSGQQRLFRSPYYNNPYWIKDNVRSTENRDHFIPSFSVDYQILPWAAITGRIGIDYYVNKTKAWENAGNRGSYPDGRIIESDIVYKQLNSDLLLRINKDISPDIKTNVLLGNNVNSLYNNQNQVQGFTLLIPDYYNLSNTTSTKPTESTSKKRTFSFYGQAELSYKDFLYVTLTGRNDWSSTLPKNNNSYFYPSISTSFIFSELISSIKEVLPYGKLRLSYSRVGLDAPVYATETGYIQANPSDGQRGNIIYPYNGIGSYLQNNIAGNADLKPELSTEWETGLEMRFLNSRIGLDVTYYNKRSKDQIFDAPIAAETGFIKRIVNAGEISNKGIELLLNLVPVVVKDFKWNIGLIYTKNQNKVIKLAEGLDNIQLAGFIDPGIFIKANYPYGVIWGSRYKRNANGQVLVDDYGYPLTDADYGPIGNVNPKWTGSISNSFSWKGLTLSALIDVRVGGDIINLDEYYTAYYGTSYLTRDRSHPVVFNGINENTGQPNTAQVDPQDYYQYMSNISEFYVQKSDFIRLREISIGYSIPKTLIKGMFIKAIDIMVTGRNLWLKTDKSFTGSDPEQSLYGSGNGQGLINYQVPSTKSYNFGLKVIF